MIKKFYNGSDGRFAREQAYLAFEEVSDGIYLIVKDRREKYDVEYASANEVASALNYASRVAVLHSGGIGGYANFNFESKGSY